MKKALPYIIIGAAVYYFWWKYNQSMMQVPSPPNPVRPEDLPLTTEDGNPLIKFGGGKKLSGIPTIF